MRRQTGNEWLAKHGGLVLVATGLALIVLAACLSTRAAVAPIFAFTGIAAVLFGALSPRMKGETEFSTNRLKFVLDDAKDVLGSGLRTPEEISNVYEQTLLRIEALLSGRTAAALPAAQPTAREEPAAQPLPPPTEPTPEAGPQRAIALEKRVSNWLRHNGWDVEEHVRVGGVEYDAVATRNGSKIGVEVKARPHIGAADVAAVAGLLDHFQLDAAHAVLVVPDGALSNFALQQAQAAQDVMSVYVAYADATFQAVSGSDIVQTHA